MLTGRRHTSSHFVFYADLGKKNPTAQLRLEFAHCLFGLINFICSPNLRPEVGPTCPWALDLKIQIHMHSGEKLVFSAIP